jgi:hypothetical protein
VDSAAANMGKAGRHNEHELRGHLVSDTQVGQDVAEGGITNFSFELQQHTDYLPQMLFIIRAL